MKSTYYEERYHDAVNEVRELQRLKRFGESVDTALAKAKAYAEDIAERWSWALQHEERDEDTIRGNIAAGCEEDRYDCR